MEFPGFTDTPKPLPGAYC